MYLLIVLHCNASVFKFQTLDRACVHNILSRIANSIVSCNNILWRHKHKDKYQSLCRKGIFISLAFGMTITWGNEYCKN